MPMNLKDPPRFPPYPVGYMPAVAERSAFPVPEAFRDSGMTLREFYAAHCPMTMDQAYDIWCNDRRSPMPGTEGYRDSRMYEGLREGKERVAFFEWWALMRFEYADAMIKEGKASNGR